MKARQSARIVPLDDLLAHPANRTDLGDLDELAESIREHGILEPLIVTEHPTELDRWLLLAGHRRVAAAKQAGLPTVPVVIRHGLDDHRDEQLIVMLCENFHRADLGPMETAEALGVLRRGGLTLAEISTRTGISASRVSALLALLELDDASRERVRAKTISATSAIDAVRDARAHHRSRTSTTVRARPAPKTKVVADWLSKTHPLTAEARDRCVHRDGARRRQIGGVACGECWESVIRADERHRPTTSDTSVSVLNGVA